MNKNISSNVSGTKSVKLPNNVNPIIAGVAGAVVGAGVGIAGAMALKNDQVREKAEKVVQSIGGKATEFAESVKKEASTQLEQKADEATEDVKKAISAKQN